MVPSECDNKYFNNVDICVCMRVGFTSDGAVTFIRFESADDHHWCLRPLREVRNITKFECKQKNHVSRKKHRWARWLVVLPIKFLNINKIYLIDMSLSLSAISHASSFCYNLLIECKVFSFAQFNNNKFKILNAINAKKYAHREVINWSDPPSPFVAPLIMSHNHEKPLSFFVHDFYYCFINQRLTIWQMTFACRHQRCRTAIE